MQKTVHRTFKRGMVGNRKDIKWDIILVKIAIRKELPTCINRVLNIRHAVLGVFKREEGLAI